MFVFKGNTLALTLNGTSYDAKNHLLLGNSKSLPFEKVKHFLLVFPSKKKISALN